ncbi:MAG: UDP-N-acetylmuramate dehydrogenase [Rhodospirillales bacterium]
MAAKHRSGRLIDALPGLRGRLSEDATLSKLTWFRVGGPAEVLFRPADADDLAELLNHMPQDVPLTVIGVGSNLLVRDGGLRGIVVRLGDGFSGVAVDGETVTAGAGASNLKIANAARVAGLAGFEFLSGIPGSLGGSLRMNAGAFGAEMVDIVTAVDALGRDGRRRLGPDEMGFSYRHSKADKNLIFVSAEMRGTPGNEAAIARRMAEIQAQRGQSQPLQTPTGGSTFINPDGHKAWELIERAGCRGLRLGGAMVSEKHCNFLINTGSATAADLEGLGEEVRRRVMAETGIRLQWEIHIIGAAEDTPLAEVDR